MMCRRGPGRLSLLSPRFVTTRWRLRDRLARPAAELLAHVLGHEPLPRDDIEGFGDILPDLRELRAAAARTGGRHRVNDATPRQVIGKVPPRRLASREAANLAARRLQPGGVLAETRREVLKLQLHLIDEPLAALGTTAVDLALHLGGHQLKL